MIQGRSNERSENISEPENRNEKGEDDWNEEKSPESKVKPELSEKEQVTKVFQVSQVLFMSFYYLRVQRNILSFSVSLFIGAI